MHLSAAIRGGGDPGEPPVICTTTFANPPYPKTRSFNKKLLTPLPPGGGERKKCALPSQKVQYFKRVLFVLINFPFVIIIHIRVLKIRIKNKQRKLFHLFSTHDAVHLTFYIVQWERREYFCFLVMKNSLYIF